MADTHLDRDVLNALQEVMEDEYPMLLDTFLADSEERLDLLRKAEDAAQLMNTAHSFKGSSSNMGAVRLAELCHELEQLAKGRKLSDIESLVGEIDREFALVRPLYEAERQRSLPTKATVQRF
ncbi:histidine kinase [Pseudomonas sp. RIT-PI-q]|uniref:Hpt domain-containing protein n=1 Tax=Pseudomonas sp. RIT-PI-q TaxID=1690247 RepID=UPI0006CC658C|nr:Hpt domain-containing protein [Pseudomonas sp. RIT-PI-q]KPG90277.1 histidine kinase [Pseudomonas sp. RIT-PI-q]